MINYRCFFYGAKDTANFFRLKNMTYLNKFSFIAGIFLMASCSDHVGKTKPDLSKMREIVKNRNALLEDCFKTGNAEKLAALYLSLIHI